MERGGRDGEAGRRAVVSRLAPFYLFFRLPVASDAFGSPRLTSSRLAAASAAFLRFGAATKSMQHFFLSLFRMLLFAYLMAGHRQNGVELYFFFCFFGGTLAVRR